MKLDIEKPDIQKHFILEGLNVLLTHNVFNFNGHIFFLQTNSTAIGTKFAPSFANLNMGVYEDMYIMGQHPLRNCIVKYKCYIDDLIFVWKGTENNFHELTNYLNINDWGLTLSGEISSKSVNYLDLNL